MRVRSTLTNLLVATVALGALVPWLGIAQAWRVTGDPNMFPTSGLEVSRLLLLADVLEYWPLQAGPAVAVIVMAAAVGVIVICGPWSDRDVPLGRRRAIVLGSGAAAAVAALSPVFRIAVVLYAMTSTPDELSGLYLTDRRGLSDLQSLSGLAVEVLGWSVVLLLGVRWWPRDDETVVADGADRADEDDVQNVGELDAGVEGSPNGGLRSLPEVPRQGATPARLRPDGSSDSGFDEFRFRR